MRIPVFSSSLGSFLILASLVSPHPAIAHASGSATKAEKTEKVDRAVKAEKKEPPAAAPRRDTSKKVYTNDDFGWFNPSASAAAASQSGQAVAGAQAESGAEPAPYDPQQDPQWYARQVTSLENDLSVIESREDALRQFRDTSSGLPTGLNVAAPTEGVTTDDFIAQLDARRQQIEQQLDDVADLARVNGFPPGTVNQPSVAEPPPPSLAEQQEAVVTEYQDVSGQLADTQATLDAMQQQAAAQGITLLPPVPDNGGNLTTNLLDGLDSQASALQSALSDAEDNARTLGVAPGDLR